MKAFDVTVLCCSIQGLFSDTTGAFCGFEFLVVSTKWLRNFKPPSKIDNKTQTQDAIKKTIFSDLKPFTQLN